MSDNSLEKSKIAVVGGGLGGLCAALAFRRRGAAVTVYEVAPAFTEVGAGIQVSSNGLRILRALGLNPGGAYRSKGTVLHDHFGKRVAILPNGAGREVRLFHRADLLSLLEDGCRAAGVEMRLDARTSPDSPPDADLVVAADGVKSVFRGIVAPDLATPQFSGQAAWRAIVRPSRPVSDAGVNVYMGPGAHVVVYPMRGGELINVVAGEDTSQASGEGWMMEVPHADMVERFAGFAGPAQEMIARASQVHRWGLYHHELPRRWSSGNIVLLGDAAHAMLPYLGQGACMAFEDALILAACWARFSDMDEALGAYERLRAPRVARVMKEVRANATRFHHGNPFARVIGHTGLRAVSSLAPGLIARRFDWLYDYDATRAS